MKKTIYLLLFLATSIASFSQEKHDYLFSYEIDSIYKATADAYHYQYFAVHYMNIGEFKKTLFMEDEFVLNFKKLNKGKIELAPDFGSYEPVKAIDEILKRAKDRQIIIINEAHYNAQNRVFTTALLEDLFQLGYQHLFVEGLKSKTNPTHDSLLNQRKYPIISSGFYFKEPQYGNMLRNAMTLGYSILPYEHGQDQEQQDPIKRWYSREEGQANNILNFLKKNPKAKIIIHCGYGHLGEKIHDGEVIGMMSAVIKKKSGIDPFTISQTKLVETFSSKNPNPYREVIDKKNLTAPSVFKNQNNELFSVKKEVHDVDVYFPPTEMTEGRPDWMFMIDNKKSVRIPANKIKSNFPYLVFAYHENEDISIAVPADIVELKDINDYKTLVLRPGNYQLVIKNKRWETQLLPLEVK